MHLRSYRFFFAALALIGALAIPAAASAASCTTSYVGSFAYTNCDNGASATTSYVGSYAYTDYTYPSSSSWASNPWASPSVNRTTNCTTNRVGNYVYTNCN